MRYRLTRSAKKKRAQVMTPPALAQRVVDLLSGEGETWLELGSGTGNLARACLAGSKAASYLGVELDERLMQRSPQDARAAFLHGNVLSPSGLAPLLGERLFSRAVGNPPYGMQALDVECQKRLAELCPGIPQIFDWVQLDLYFMLESLARLRRPGEAAFIVGAPIAEDARLVAFRLALLSSASEVECFELPIDVFDWKAEVQSFVLVARFGDARHDVPGQEQAKPPLDLVEKAGMLFRHMESHRSSPALARMSRASAMCVAVLARSGAASTSGPSLVWIDRPAALEPMPRSGWVSGLAARPIHVGQAAACQAGAPSTVDTIVRRHGVSHRSST